MTHQSAYDLQQALIATIKLWPMPKPGPWKWGEGKYQPEKKCTKDLTSTKECDIMVAESGATRTGRKEAMR